MAYKLGKKIPNLKKIINLKKVKIMLPTFRSRIPEWATELFNKDVFDFAGGRSLANVPAANISESDNEFKIEMAAPGLDKGDLEINVENDVLTISSRKEAQKEEKDENYMRKEFSFQSFSRSFVLPTMADADNIKATQENGIISINIPKKEEARKKPVKQISIE